MAGERKMRGRAAKKGSVFRIAAASLGGMVVFWLAFLLTIWSGWDYFRQFYRVFLTKRKS